VTLIELEESQKVAVAEIDAQHEALVDLVNQLHDSMMAGSDRDALDGILSELLQYTAEHFAYEEQLMLRHAYPGYEKHKADHTRLMDHVNDLARRFRAGDLLLSFAVMLDLKAWATVHIEKADKPLGVFLNRQTDRPRLDDNSSRALTD
jgi:hemerythrin